MSDGIACEKGTERERERCQFPEWVKLSVMLLVITNPEIESAQCKRDLCKLRWICTTQSLWRPPGIQHDRIAAWWIKSRSMFFGGLLEFSMILFPNGEFNRTPYPQRLEAPRQ